METSFPSRAASAVGWPVHLGALSVRRLGSRSSAVLSVHVPLEGRLGADWGVIVNPESVRFAQLTFEHDDCGCPDRIDRGEGPVHVDAPSQQGDTWDVDWRHECNDFCELPCQWRNAVAPLNWLFNGAPGSVMVQDIGKG